MFFSFFFLCIVLQIGFFFFGKLFLIFIWVLNCTLGSWLFFGFTLFGYVFSCNSQLTDLMFVGAGKFATGPKIVGIHLLEVSGWSNLPGGSLGRRGSGIWRRGGKHSGAR